MKTNLLQTPVGTMALDYIAHHYGWHAKVYLIVTYWDYQPINATDQIEAVEEILGCIVSGRYYLLDDIFFSGEYSSIDIKIYFEREEDALMFKLAWN